jgi:uncharacterized membrane protein
MNPPLAVRGIVLVLGTVSAVVHWFIPRLTRPDLYFAVTVAPGFRESSDGRLILSRYRRGVIGVSALTLPLLGAVALTSAFPLAPLAILAQLGAFFAVFYRARRLVMPHRLAPTTIREARVERHNRRIPGGWVLASGPFAVLAASAIYLYTHWRRIPARFAVHFGAGGLPDRWAARSAGIVFLPILDAAVVLLGMTLVIYGIAHWLRPIHAAGAEGSHESRFRRTTSALLLASEYSIALVTSWVALRPLLPASHQRPPAAIAFLPGLIPIVLVVLWMKLGQGGSRMLSPRTQGPSAAQPVGDRTEDRYWKLGIFYFNRDDPSVMVEKRFGIGYTMNFAHPISWVIVLLLVLAPIVITATVAVRHRAR